MEIGKRLSGIDEYYFAGKLRAIELMNNAGKKVINLGIGSPDLPPHYSVTDTLCLEAAKPSNHGYQNYKGNIILREAIQRWYSKWYNVDLDPSNEILPLFGSKEGIMHVCMTYLNPGDSVLIPNPGYPTYRSVATLAGAECFEYKLTERNNWLPDLESLANCDLQNTKLMFVNYPNMPTGKLPNKNLFNDLISFATDNEIVICHDNPYSFILNPEPMSMLSIDGAKEVVIELNSLSKSHNMAGWRIGMMVGKEQFISQVMRFKSNMDSGMFLPVQLAASKALELGKEWFTHLNNIYEKRRLSVYNLLKHLNCSFDPVQGGMFVWAKIPPQHPGSYPFSDSILANAHVFITPGSIFGSEGDRYVRVSLCSSENIIASAIDRIRSTILV